MTPAERARYCFIHVDHESLAERESLLEQLRGTWTYYPTTDTDYRRKEFYLHLGNRIAAETSYRSLGRDVESIQFDKLCVSKPLDVSFGELEGFRFFEMMADNNEGGVALLFKFSRNSIETVLNLSERYYEHHADQVIVEVQDAISRGKISTLRAFGGRR